jgi:hypothetical protein
LNGNTAKSRECGLRAKRLHKRIAESPHRNSALEKEDVPKNAGSDARIRANDDPPTPARSLTPAKRPASGWRCR